MQDDKSPNPNKCPNCGGTFVTVMRPEVDTESLRGAAIQKNRDKLNDTRGELQRCERCGYERRAKDEIKPATAARV